MTKFIKGDATKEVDAKFTNELLALGWELAETESKVEEPKEPKAKKPKVGE